MAETLGSLCDKLTVVKLKEWHADDPARVESLRKQEQQLQQEIAEYLAAECRSDFLSLTLPPSRCTREGDPNPKKPHFWRSALNLRCEMPFCIRKRLYEFEQVQAEKRIRSSNSTSRTRTHAVHRSDRSRIAQNTKRLLNRATTKFSRSEGSHASLSIVRLAASADPALTRPRSGRAVSSGILRQTGEQPPARRFYGSGDATRCWMKRPASSDGEHRPSRGSILLLVLLRDKPDHAFYCRGSSSPDHARPENRARTRHRVQ
jgi:hypothetical protein